jgi:disulfide bond formation protein DsbB
MATPTPTTTTPVPKGPPQESRLVTRLLALVVIFVGLALVGYVFMEAKKLFEAPTPALPPAPPTPKPLPGATPAPENAVGSQALAAGWRLADLLGRRLLSLLVMCLSGSLIAALGIRWWGKR